MSYYAVRKPDEFKGVYLNKDKYAELSKKFSGKGFSGREFSDKDIAEAFKWASVKGIADAEQQVVENRDVINSSVKAFMEVVEDYRNKGFDYIELTLNTGIKHGLFLYNYAYIEEGYFLSTKYSDRGQNILDTYKQGKINFIEATDISATHCFILFNELYTTRSSNSKTDCHNELGTSTFGTINVSSIAEITPFIYTFKNGAVFSEKDIEFYNEVMEAI